MKEEKENITEEVFASPENINEAGEEEIPGSKKETPSLKKKKHHLSKEEKKERFLKFGNGCDMKYRGPLGIRSLKIIAWMMMVFSAASIGLTLLATLGAMSRKDNTGLFIGATLLSTFGALAVPSFMLCKFATIFQKKKGYLSMSLVYGGIMVMIALIFYLAFFHYGVLFYQTLMGTTFKEATDNIASLVRDIMGNKTSFNVFVDMFLWSVFFLFIDATYSWMDKKWKIILFRSLSVLPLFYVIFTFILKVMQALDNYQISPLLMPFMPVSTPVTYISFISVALFLKLHRMNYLKIGGSEEEYENYLKSNANSFHFAKLTAVAFLFTGLVDVIIYAVIQSNVGDAGYLFINVTGIGSCMGYLLFAPFILLFSYTRVYSDSKADILIPLIGICCMVLVVLEGGYQALLEWLSYLKGLLE